MERNLWPEHTFQWLRLDVYIRAIILFLRSFLPRFAYQGGHHVWSLEAKGPDGMEDVHHPLSLQTLQQDADGYDGPSTTTPITANENKGIY